MKEAAKIEPILTRTISKLGNLGEIQGSRRPPVRLNAAKRKIGYVKIRRGEVCTQPVLSDCEKYNVVQAEFTPLVDAMQRLPSHEFYERFADLRGLLNMFKQQWGLTGSLDTSTEDTADEFESEHSENENDLLEEISEALSSRQTPSHTEPDTDLTEFLVDFPSQVSQPDIELSEASQRILDGGDTAQGTGTVSPRPSNCSSTQEQLELHQQAALEKHQAAQLPNTVRSHGAVVSGVDVIKLHQAPLATSTANITQQKKACRGTVHLHCDCPIDVESLFLWAQHFSDKDRVCEIIDRYPVLFSEPFLLTRRPEVVMRIAPTNYNFFIPRGVLASVSSAFANWDISSAKHREDRTVHDLDADSTGPVAVAVLATHGEFPRYDFHWRYAAVVKQIYAVRELINSYQDDLEWIRRDWAIQITADGDGVNSPLHIASIMPSIPIMAQQVAQLLAESWLTRKFILRSGAAGKGGFLQLTNVVGRLAGKSRLSDPVMYCALQYVFSHHCTLCFTVDLVHVEREEFVFPANALAAYSHVIIPVFMRALKHWVIQIVTLPSSSDKDLTLVLYDPLGVEAHYQPLKDKWNSYTKLLLQKWHARDCKNTGNAAPEYEQSSLKENVADNAADSPTNSQGFSPSVKEVLLLHPRQPDAVSCGVLCIALAYSHVIGDERFKQIKVVKRAEVDAMRLCIMWQLLCDCDEKQNVADATFNTWPDVQAVDKKISQHFKATSRSKATL